MLLGAAALVWMVRHCYHAQPPSPIPTAAQPEAHGRSAVQIGLPGLALHFWRSGCVSCGSWKTGEEAVLSIMACFSACSQRPPRIPFVHAALAAGYPPAFPGVGL